MYSRRTQTSCEDAWFPCRLHVPWPGASDHPGRQGLYLDWKAPPAGRPCRRCLGGHISRGPGTASPVPGGPSALGSGTQAQPPPGSRRDARSRAPGQACRHSRVFAPQGTGRRKPGLRSRPSVGPCSGNEAKGAAWWPPGVVTLTPAALRSSCRPRKRRTETGHAGHRPPARPPLPRAAAPGSGALSFASARGARPTVRHSAGDRATRPRAPSSRRRETWVRGPLPGSRA